MEKEREGKSGAPFFFSFFLSPPSSENVITRLALRAGGVGMEGKKRAIFPSFFSPFPHPPGRVTTKEGVPTEDHAFPPLSPSPATSADRKIGKPKVRERKATVPFLFSLLPPSLPPPFLEASQAEKKPRADETV